MIALVDVTFTEGEPATYALPLAGRREGDDIGVEHVVARVETTDGVWLVVDGLRDAALAGALLEMMERRRVARGQRRRLAGTGAEGFVRLRGKDPLEPQFAWGEQSNTSVTFGDRLVLKLFRRLEEGVNPELEVGRFLTDRTVFRHSAPTAGGDRGPRSRNRLDDRDPPGLRPERGRRVGVRARRRQGVLRTGARPADRSVRPPGGTLGDGHGRRAAVAPHLRPDRALPRLGVAPRAADGAAAPRAGLEAGRSGVRAGAVHADVPTLDVSVDAIAGGLDPAPPEPATGRPEVEELLDREEELLSRYTVVAGERISDSGSGSTATTTSGRCCGPGATS